MKSSYSAPRPLRALPSRMSLLARPDVRCLVPVRTNHVRKTENKSHAKAIRTITNIIEIITNIATNIMKICIVAIP